MFLRQHRPLIAAVQRAIRERGPLGNADFERPKHMGKGGGWWSWKPATHALDSLWKAGYIGVHSRVHFHKRFAAMDRVLPAFEAATPLPALDAILAMHVQARGGMERLKKIQAIRMTGTMRGPMGDEVPTTIYMQRPDPGCSRAGASP